MDSIKVASHILLRKQRREGGYNDLIGDEMVSRFAASKAMWAEAIGNTETRRIRR